MTVLVIATHPDDEVLGCGGVMAKHVAEGSDVVVLVVTRGAPDIYADDHVEQVRGELQAAHQVLGVSDVIFLDFPAPKLDTTSGHVLADAIRQVIIAHRPNLIYFPHRGDIHADHQAVYQATLVAARPLGGNPVGKLLSYETLSETEWAAPLGSEAFVPTVFVDISDYLDKKLKAMSCYRSQLHESPHPRSLRSIKALAQFRGGTISVAAAEAFMLVREVVR